MSKSERLVYWYLRLNGFLLWENFIVHPDEGREQRTDADLIGIRFNNRIENIAHPMKDDLLVADRSEFCNVIIAEVKRSVCSLNGPWTTPSGGNMQRVLRAIGCIPKSKIELAARELYNNGCFFTNLISCRLFAFGDHEGHIEIPGVRQIMFSEVIRFIYDRFTEYSNEKSSIESWAYDGKKLKQLVKTSHSYEDYVNEVRKEFDLKNE